MNWPHTEKRASTPSLLAVHEWRLRTPSTRATTAATRSPTRATTAATTSSLGASVSWPSLTGLDANRATTPSLKGHAWQFQHDLRRPRTEGLDSPRDSLPRVARTQALPNPSHRAATPLLPCHEWPFHQDVPTQRGEVEDSPRDSFVYSVQPKIACKRQSIAVVQKELAYKRQEVSTNHLAEAESQKNVAMLLHFCRDFKSLGQGQECSFLGHVRGLDILYKTTRAQTALRGSRRRQSAGVAADYDAMSSYIRKGQQGKQAQNASDRAASVLKDAPFFRKVEVEFEGTIDLLANSGGVKFVRERAGQLIMRQGDSAKNAYIVTGGKVSVWTLESNEDKENATPRGTDPSVKHTMSESLDEDDRRVGPKIVEKEKPRGLRMTARVESKPKVEIKPRYRTSEGYSTFSVDSTIGGFKAFLGPGTVFGEVALQNNDPRGATIRCHEDCEFLVIDKAAYQGVLSKSIAQLKFFNEYLPSLLSGGYTGRHPCYDFRWRTFKQGHIFLREGIASIEPQVFLVFRGIVEFRRYEHSSANANYILASRPLDRKTWAPHCERPMTGIAGSEPGEKPWWGDLPRQGQQLLHDELGEGDAFCSLPFIPLYGSEPFTVTVATDECEIFCAGPAELRAIGDHHEERLRSLRQQLMPGITKRIKQLSQV